jgi:hypothetical protein
MERDFNMDSYFIKMSENEFSARLSDINSQCSERWGGRADSYCSPVIDKFGFYYMQILPEYLEFFSENELAISVLYSEIEFSLSDD